MPRRGFIPKREVLPDPVYGTTIITKLINQVMYDGKRGVAQAVCYDAFETVAAKTGKDAMEVFNDALANILPSLEVKARRDPKEAMKIVAPADAVAAVKELLAGFAALDTSVFN